MPNTAAAFPTLPIEQRKWKVKYRNEDDTVGEEAYPINYEEIYNLKGRLLTLVDATFTDPEQRKAQKDLVWQTLQGWMDAVRQDAENPLSRVPHDEDRGPVSAASSA